MSGQLYLTYRNMIYLLAYDHQRIEIYSSEDMEMVQTIRNLFVDITQVINVGEANFVAITHREAVFYALTTTSRKELFWKKMSTEIIEEVIIGAAFCKSSSELILLSPNLIQSVQCRRKDDQRFVRQSELSLGWMVSVKQELKAIEVSGDDELLALLTDKGKIFVWNLKLVPTLFKKNMNLAELGDNSCALAFDDVVEKMEFKRTLAGDTTNCLYALSHSHLRVMTEVREAGKFSFITLLNVRIQGLVHFIQIESLLPQHKVITSNTLHLRNMESVDPLILQIGGRFFLYELYAIRSSLMRGSFKEVKEIQVGVAIINKALLTAKRQLYLISEENNNICQVVLDLGDNKTSPPPKQFLKIYLKIVQCFFSESSKYVVLRLEDGIHCRKNLTFNNWLNSNPVDPSITPLNINTTSPACLNGDILYFVQDELFHLFNVADNTDRTIPLPRSVRYISFLLALPTGLYFVFDGQIMVLRDDKIQSFSKVVPAKQVMKVEVVHSSRSILFKTQRGYWLYEYFVEDQALKLAQIRKSTEHMIYGGGYWTQLRESEIIFGRQGRSLVSFNLDTFLAVLSKKHNLRGLKYKLGHLQDEVFTLQIENYFFFLAVVLDIRKQKYCVNVLRKNIHTNDYLVIRIPRKAALERTHLIYINNCFYVWADLQLLIIGKYPQDPVGVDYQDLTQSVAYLNAYIHQPMPVQSPFFLKELLSMGLLNQVDAILQDLSILIRKQPLDPFLSLPCMMISKLLNKELGGLKLDSSTLIEDLKFLEDVVIEKPEETGLADNLPLLLSDIIDFSRFRLENQRSLDLASSVFLSRVRRVFTTRQKISTRDVCWALHTLNKQEMFMFLIEQPLERKDEGMSWKIIKKFCVVLWLDDVSQTKQWVEKIALSEFKITKDPFDCLLWYILLGKKNILSVLLKKNEQNIKTFEFLQRDFTQENHRTAASKNAYALLSKKRFEHAIAFFILAASYKDAVTVCLNQLQDPQLAILICKLFKAEVGPEMVREIYEKTLLQTGKVSGDPWMMHIGYYLLGQHVQSYNCLFSQGCNFDIPTPESGAPIVCDTWRAEFQPQLSFFHPSLIFFSNILKQSLPVKRELQESGEQLNLQIYSESVINSCIDYYIQLNVPEVAIAFTIQNLEHLTIQTYRKQKLASGYLNRLLALSIRSKSVTSSLAIIREISDLMKMDQTLMTQTFQKRLQDIDCGELLFDFYAQTNNLPKSKSYIFNFKNQLVMFMLYQNTSRLESRQPYLIALHLIFWGERMIPKCVEMGLEVKDLQIYLTVLKLIILLRLEQTRELLVLLNNLVDSLGNKEINYTFWPEEMYKELNQLVPTRRNRIETAKTSKKMDILEEVFRKTYEDETVSTEAPPEAQLVLLMFRSLVFDLIICKIPAESYLQQIVISERKRAEELLDIFLSEDRIQAMLNQFLLVVSEGVHAWNKTSILNSNTNIDKDEIVPALQLLGAQTFLAHKAGVYKYESLVTPGRDSFALKENIFKNGVEIFKNRTEPIKDFVLNNFESSQQEMVVFFKRQMKKFDIYHSLLNKVRNSEGCCLIEDDLPTPTNDVVKFVNHQPLISTCNDLLRCSFNKKYNHIIRFEKSIDLNLTNYLKQLDPLPFVNPNELNCVSSHRYLPLFFVGSRSSIDVFSFSNMRNFNRINCRDLGDLVKVGTNYNNEMIGACDSDGNFSSFHFDSSYEGRTSIMLKRQGIVDFSYMWSNIVATAGKDGSLNVIDPLLHPSSSSVFREKLSGLTTLRYLPKSQTLVAMRRSQIFTYDVRMGGLSHMETGSEIRCMNVDPLSEQVYAGNSNGEIKVFDKEGQELVTLRPFRASKKQSSVVELKVSKGNLFALSSEGTISYAFS